MYDVLRKEKSVAELYVFGSTLKYREAIGQIKTVPAECNVFARRKTGSGEEVIVDAGRSYVEIGALVEGERTGELEGIVGSSAALRGALDQVRTVAPTDSTVLIEAETGTGKELIARAIHLHSKRRNRPFITLNCAAIPRELFESELFGHERGAFTGATAQRLGRFEAADGGTLFLDEIGDMPLEFQVKLLRVLQQREFERVGSTHSRQVDVRIVAATNQDLAALVTEKQFRKDLYYRLNVFPIALPPLRSRCDDIPILVAYFVDAFAKRMSKQISQISQEAMDALTRYSWPGNIRELQNYIERAVILTQGDILQIPPLPSHTPVSTVPTTLAEAERDHILKALEESNWVVGGKSGAAARLGMPRTTLINKMRKRDLLSNSSRSRSVQTTGIADRV
jgi:formate hydrogenlyase transcriptional activator